MIVKGIFELFYNMITVIFSFINLPDLPAEVQTVVDSLLQFMSQGLNLIGFFCHPAVVKIVVPLTIVFMNFDKLYKLVMFVLRKIPFLGIE